VLGRYPDLTATELAERTAMDKGAVSRAVASLVAEGRLTRKVDGEDRRRTRLRLSAKGYRIYDEVAPLALRLPAAPARRAQWRGTARSSMRCCRGFNVAPGA
jgi:DNA-binding MarR family transcriptional regulator